MLKDSLTTAFTSLAHWVKFYNTKNIDFVYLPTTDSMNCIHIYCHIQIETVDSQWLKIFCFKHAHSHLFNCTTKRDYDMYLRLCMLLVYCGLGLGWRMWHSLQVLPVCYSCWVIWRDMQEIFCDEAISFLVILCFNLVWLMQCEVHKCEGTTNSILC